MVKLTLNDLITIFCNQIQSSLSPSSLNGYCSYIRQIDKLNNSLNCPNGTITDWILNLSKGKNPSPVNTILNYVGNLCTLAAISPKVEANYKSVMKKLAYSTIGFFNANVWLAATFLDLCRLVASNAIFADPAIVDKVKQQTLGSKENLTFKGKFVNPFASWDCMTSLRNTSKPRGTVIPSTVPLGSKLSYPPLLRADNNTHANIYFKTAITKSLPQGFSGKFTGYEVCHIWPLANDRRYYTSISNMVLLPQAIAAMSDFMPQVIEMLQYRAFDLFHFKPENEPNPKKPSFYNKIVWRVRI